MKENNQIAHSKRQKDSMYSQQLKSGFHSVLVLVPTLSFHSCRAASCSCSSALQHLSPVSISLCKCENVHPVSQRVRFHRSKTQFPSAGCKCQLSTFFPIQCKLSQCRIQRAGGNSISSSGSGGVGG